MHKTFFIIVFICFGIHCVVAQKVLEKEFAAEGLHALYIEDDAIFKIEIFASKRETIQIKAKISGEHSEAIIIEENFLNGTLSLKTGLMPYFAFENDKLAAHKLMAVEIMLFIPENISVKIKSELASLEATGNIKKLAVSLQNGSCTLTNFLGNAHLKTANGDISVLAKMHVSGRAISKHGTVNNTLPKDGRFLIEAESVNGNIMLLQTK
ncbi:DUF4097 family beta strand repeat-containing protein [Aequorivita viscosa]|nr:DUF4097 family beta strand repeat-containing protein [Aequorivita viscosa]